MCLRHYSRRLRIWETDFGRDAGWVIEREGQAVAILTEPRWEEMFWYSYRLEAVAADPELRKRILTEEFWAGNGPAELAWRSKEFGEVAEHAFPAMSPFPEPGRVMMRGLYLPISGTWPWDRVVLWLRRTRRKGRA
jgi:hypothetical protein